MAKVRRSPMRKLFDELTPEKIAEMRLKRIERIKALTAEFQLGLFVGMHIVDHFLPTLSTDMLQSRNVIKVSDEDATKYKELSDDWYNKHNDKNVDEYTVKTAWDVHFTHMKELDKKYLPHVLECHLPALNITNMSEFKKGIEVALWDCDMCSYKVNEDEFDVINDDHRYFTRIDLKLDID